MVGEAVEAEAEHDGRAAAALVRGRWGDPTTATNAPVARDHVHWAWVARFSVASLRCRCFNGYVLTR